MMLGYQAYYSETSCDFFSIRPTGAISGNAFDTKRKKEGGDGLTRWVPFQRSRGPTLQRLRNDRLYSFQEGREFI